MTARMKSTAKRGPRTKRLQINAAKKATAVEQEARLQADRTALSVGQRCSGIQALWASGRPFLGLEGALSAKNQTLTNLSLSPLLRGDS